MTPTLETQQSSYQDFLASKIVFADAATVTLGDLELHPSLFGHQRTMTEWALRNGRGLIAASFGLGKSRVQCEIARQLHASSGEKFLLVCPLGVKHQFAEEDGPSMGMDWQYVRTTAEAQAATSPYLITNYERVRDGALDPRQLDLCGVSLDEGSVLRSLGSKTYQTFLDVFADVPHRYVCTATPSPNKTRELIYYAQFLGVMDVGQALTRFFQRNPDKAGDLQVHPQHAHDFWLWVASWALFLYAPSDIGYSDEGYELPEIRVHWHCVPVDQTRAFDQEDDRGQHKLLLDGGNCDVRNDARERRATLDARKEKVLEIVLQSLSKQTSNTEAKNANPERAEQGVLRSEQRERETAELELLSSEQSEDRPRTKEGLHGGIPENLQAEADNAGKEAGGKSEAAREICDRPAISAEAKRSCESETSVEPGSQKVGTFESGIQPDNRRVSGDVGDAGQRLCNLRSEGNGSVGEGETATVTLGRPRSQDGQGAGDSLSPLQLCNRSATGQPGTAAESGGISDQIILWCQLNEEQKALEKLLKDQSVSFSSLTGSQDIELREGLLYEWLNKETTVFLSKPSMYGAGVNMQQCHTMIFAAVDYKFEEFIQAIHRVHRFQQKNEVDVHIIYAETQQGIVQVLKQKWAQHIELSNRMRDIVREFGLSHEALKSDLKRRIGVDRVEAKGQRYTAVNNDCVDEVGRMADNSVGFIHTSIPFGNHYEYTVNYEDFGHNPSDEAFFGQMDFLIPELLRVLEPGRIAAIHVKDRVLYGHQTQSGFMEISPFSDETVMAFRKHGWLYEGRITVVTDVVRENNSSYRLGWTEMCKDGSKMGCGLPEYVLLFRKPPTDSANHYADTPVVHTKADYSIARWQLTAHSYWRSDGRALSPYNFEEHVARMEIEARLGKLSKEFLSDPPRSDCDMVWDDVLFMRCLNARQVAGGKVKHICPLPLDIIERVIDRFTNPGDVVFEPFMGIGSVIYQAVKMGRHGYGVELNSEYFHDACKYCRQAEIEVMTPRLFEDVEEPEAVAV